MESGCIAHDPAALPPVKTRYPLYRELVGPPDRYGRVRKTLPLNGIRSSDGPVRTESLYRLRNPGPAENKRTDGGKRKGTVLISALFWDVMQRIVTIPCGSFGTTYLFQLQ